MSDSLDIAGARSELGLSQKQFAELLGVDQSTVSLWECGKAQPRGPAVRLIERVLADERSKKGEAA